MAGNVIMWRNGGRRTRNGLYIYLGFRRLVGEALSPPGEGFEREREGVEGMEGREGRGGEMVGVRLFGVTICGAGAAEELEGGGWAAGLEMDVMRKSKSMGNLASAAAENGAGERGYLSDGGFRKCRRRRRRAGAGGHDRKKGIPWTEEEHRTFLEGLEKLGKGDWRGIARKFVLTRTPTQVASHAQKYFIRQTTPSNKKRRSSLFDVVINDVSTLESVPMVSLNKTQKGSKEILLHQDSKKEGTPELNAGLASSLGPERLPPIMHFMNKWMDVYQPRSFNRTEEASDFMEDKQMALEPKVPQTLSLMLSAPQSTVSSKLHPNQTPFPQELQPLPCCPAQANKPHYIAEGNDLELSIAPPKPHSLSKVLSQNGVGAIRVV